MRKKFLFSSRTYSLRKWIEKTYQCSEPIHSLTSESVYYSIDLSHGREFKIRISDHLKHSSSSMFQITVVPDFSDINKTIYIVQNGSSGIMTFTSLSILKYEITRNIEVIRSSAWKVDIESPAIEVLKQDDQQKFPFEKIKNSHHRMNYWPSLCRYIEGYSILPKMSRAAIREIFSANVDFDKCISIVNKIINLKTPSGSKTKNLKKTANSLIKEFGRI